MNGRARVVLAATLALAAAIAPVLAALYFADRRARANEQWRAVVLAHEVLARADRVSAEARIVVGTLAQARGVTPCSAANLTLMRDLALRLTEIVVVGYVQDNRLLCSSFGAHGEGLPLGAGRPADTANVFTRSDVQFPFVRDTEFLVADRDGVAVFINRWQTIVTLQREPDIVVATFDPATRVVRNALGEVRPSWLAAARRHEDTTVVDADHVVALVESTQYATGVVAAIPTSSLTAARQREASGLLPLAALAGLALAALVAVIARRDVSMATMLKLALWRDELFLEYQPIVNLRTRRIVGAEALLRWRRSDGSLVAPEDFVGHAERAGVITQLTERVLTIAAADARLLRAHSRLFLSLNLSSPDVESSALPARLERFLRDSGSAAHEVSVELTERSFLKPDVAEAAIAAIRQRGIGVTIDDFGTGYSSLGYLARFRIDGIKIDRSFVRTIGSDAATSHVASHIIKMASALEISVIAEGVESEAQAQFLEEHGVILAQGWLFGRPMPVAELAACVTMQNAA